MLRSLFTTLILLTTSLASAQPTPPTLVCKGNGRAASLTLTATELKLNYAHRPEVVLAVRERQVLGAGISGRTVVELDRGAQFSYFDRYGCPKKAILKLPSDLPKVGRLSCNNQKDLPACEKPGRH
jgi:hypothetical protein